MGHPRLAMVMISVAGHGDQIELLFPADRSGS
jgi:hypothetical protein